MVVWRLEPSGALDPTFGGRGWITHDGAAGAMTEDAGSGITLDSSGRILVAGDSISPNPDPDMVVWRLLPDGSLDLAFGGQGWVVHHDAAGGDSFDIGTDVATDGSGRILVSGYSFGTIGPREEMIVWRYLPDGSLDTTFDGDGWLVAGNATGADDNDGGSALALDPTGRIVVTGYSDREPGVNRAYDMATWRVE